MFEENIEFKPMIDYPGYFITDDGRVFKVKEMSSQLNSSGYKYVSLTTSKNKVKHVSVHREVAKAFVEGDKSLTVDHLDGDKTNNVPENLRWLSLRENIREPQKKEYVFEHRDGRTYSCVILRDFCREFNLDPSSVSKLLKGKLAYHKGWRLPWACA